MIEYYILIFIGAVGLALCIFLLFRIKRIKKIKKIQSSPQPSQIFESETKTSKMKLPPSMKHWENVFAESEEKEDEEI